MKIRLFKIPLLFLCILWALISQATTYGYPVVVKNKSSEPIIVELAQYHAEKYDGAQPKEFSNKLLVERIQVNLSPGKAEDIMYNSAVGGFWVVWQVVSPSSGEQQSGVLRLLEGDRLIEIK